MTDRPRKNITESRRFLFNELGKSGLRHGAGLVHEEYLPQLQGTRGVRVFMEMRDNSPIIGAMMFAIDALLRSVDWRVQPNSDDPADIEAAEFLESCMSDMDHTWEDFVSEVLSMLTFGWSYFEMVYKVRRGQRPRGGGRRSLHDDGRIGWHKFGIRAQETLQRWEIDENGDVKGLWQLPPSNFFMSGNSSVVFVPASKSLHFRTTARKNNPEGRSVLRNSYRPWYYAKRIEEIEAIGVDRDLAGLPIAKVPPELLSSNRTADQEATYNYIRDVVTRTKRDEQEGLIWPLEYDESGKELYIFELLSTGSRRQFDTGAIIQRYNQQMAMTILADFILLGHESVGSFALSSDKTELFAVALGSWLDTIQETLNRVAVTQLFELNNFDVEELPQIEHGDIEKPNLTELADFVSKLAAAGMPFFPNIEMENRLLELGDLPQQDPEERERQMEMQEAAQMAEIEAKMRPPDGAQANGQRAAEATQTADDEV